jgi:hypothetical protein
MPSARVNNQAGRFVHNDDVGIGVHDAEYHRLIGLRRRNHFLFTELHGQELPLPEWAAPSMDGHTIHLHPTTLYQPVDGGTGDICQ